MLDKKVLSVVAKIISAVSMPNFIPLYFYPILGYYDAPGTFWVLLVAIGVAPLALTLLYWRIAGISHNFAPSRQSRIIPFIIAICFAVGAWLWLRFSLGHTGWDGAQVLLITYLIGLIIGFVVTFFWKVSLHMIGAAIFLLPAYLLLQIHWGFLYFILPIPVIGWARMYLKSHDIWQILVGLLLGVASIVIATYGMGFQLPALGE